MSIAARPSRIRALFFDLDGTLLTSSKTLAESTVRALGECRRAGIGIHIATARPPTVERQLTLPAEEMALLTGGGVFLNGALVKMGERSEYRFLPAAAVRAMIDAAWPLAGVNIALQRSGERHAFRYPLPGDTYRLWGMRGLREPDYVPFPEPGEAPDDVAKVVLFGAADAIREGIDLTDLYGTLRGRVGGVVRLYLTDKGTVLQGMGAEVTKKSGVDIAVRMAGLAADQVAVFGDDVNDREMLASFPNSVAMANADPETRAAAAHVTRGNDEDGISHALRGILRILPEGQ
jgi:hydroxymethylpyrimidine pyrophosphatase-like HAD family hydrolase